MTHIDSQTAGVLEALMPRGLTETMQELALHLYTALVLREPQAPGHDRLAELARTALAQLAHVSAEMGGAGLYLAKGLMAELSVRDREICAKFTGNNYRQLAQEYDLSEMRVRQIIAVWREEERRRRQGNLPGFDA